MAIVSFALGVSWFIVNRCTPPPEKLCSILTMSEKEYSILVSLLQDCKSDIIVNAYTLLRDCYFTKNGDSASKSPINKIVTSLVDD